MTHVGDDTALPSRSVMLRPPERVQGRAGAPTHLDLDLDRLSLPDHLAAEGGFINSEMMWVSSKTQSCDLTA
jgi:hypothetical protein